MNDRPRINRRNIATNADFLKAENRVMRQDQTTITGKLTETYQYFPHNHARNMFHLQLESKQSSGSTYLETFQCYHVSRGAGKLERLLKRYGC